MPEVEELPLSATEVLLQVKVPPVAIAPGTEVFIGTTVEAVEEHPLVGFLTVKIYVPEVFTTGFCVVEV